jgi:ribosomal protein S18 acetylase RimI-like enzyme
MPAPEPLAHPLDNPVWLALTTLQSRFAEGTELARRFPVEITRLAAMRELSPDCLADLHQLCATPAGVLFVAPPKLAGWTILREFPLAQMVCDGLRPVNSGQPFDELGPADAAAMLALAELTQPGPFGLRTGELGSYLGIRNAGTLIAMAGERMRLPGYTEISAVCTHPDRRGRGYAAVLMSELMRRIATRGETPFLHVRQDNTGAIRIYERLGFTIRRVFHFMVLRGV